MTFNNSQISIFRTLCNTRPSKMLPRNSPAHTNTHVLIKRSTACRATRESATAEFPDSARLHSIRACEWSARSYKRGFREVAHAFERRFSQVRKFSGRDSSAALSISLRRKLRTRVNRWCFLFAEKFISAGTCFEAARTRGMTDKTITKIRRIFVM